MSRNERPDHSGEKRATRNRDQRVSQSADTAPTTLYTKDRSQVKEVGSPVLQLLLQYEEGTQRRYAHDSFIPWVGTSLEEHFREKVDKERQSFRNKEQDRQSFVTFAEREGLAEITTPRDFHEKGVDLTERLMQLDPPQLFDRLKELQHYYRIGRSLLQDANNYLAIREVLDHEDYNNLDASTLAEQHPQAMHAYRGKLLPNSAEFSAEGLMTSDASSDEAIHFSPWNKPTKLQQEAETFALHKEGLLTAYLYFNLTGIFSDALGEDSYMGGAVSAKDEIETWEQAQRYSKPFTPKFSQWMQRGFRSEFFNGIERDYDYTQMEPAEKYLHLAMVIAPEESASVDPLSRRSISALKRHLFDEVIGAFSEATEPLHPQFESHVREYTGYLLSGDRLALEREAKEKDTTNSLAELVPTIRELGYRKGIYLDPLFAEMKLRLQQSDLDPKIVAGYVEQALVARETGGELSHSVPAEIHWFIDESLRVQSTLDGAGNYQPLHDDLHKEKRALDVVGDIIDILKQMPM